MKCKLLNLILVLMMLFSTVPQSAAADEAVAEINGVTYKSLQEAFDVAASKGVIYLLKDVTVDQTVITVKGSNHTVIDLQGHTITGTENADPVLYNSTMLSLFDSVGGGGVKAASLEHTAIKSVSPAFTTLITDGSYYGKIDLVSSFIPYQITGGSFNPIPDSSLYNTDSIGFKYNEATGYYDSTSYLASVNGVKKLTLQEAVDAAEKGDTVKLLNTVPSLDNYTLNIYADDDIILDLNGYNYTASTLYTTGDALINNAGKLVITNSNDSDVSLLNMVQTAIDPDNPESESESADIVYNTGELTLDGNLSVNLLDYGTTGTGKIINNMNGGTATVLSGSYTHDMSEFVPVEYYVSYNEYTNSSGSVYYMYDIEPRDYAETIAVEFIINEEEAEEGELLYDIVLTCANDKLINRVNSVDLTFDFTYEPARENTEMYYEIVPAEDITLTTKPGVEFKDRYMFNFKNKEEVNDTGILIPIGQVRFTGYGTFSFGVNEEAIGENVNIVNVTKTENNIVDTFVVDAESDQGSLDVSKRLENIVNEVPSAKLEINIDFNNSISNNDVKYQNMSVVISGGDLEEDIVVKLGTDYEFTGTTDDASTDKDDDTAEYTDNSYKIILGKELTKNVAYTVTVQGDGYRTARYTVSMTKDKVLNFWNNVMDYPEEIEKGKTTSSSMHNFLAGDIVKDNNINVYDLSAVVSYFGVSATAANGYAKYDLNRDNVIDSKDVAYVLVSWDN